MAIKSSKSNNSSIISDINITPFVDIVLVLLIIFMISTPIMVQESLKISLPMAKTAKNYKHVTLQIYIQKNGSLLIANKKYKLTQLGKILQQVKKDDQQFDVIVSADKNVPHGKVIKVIDLIKQSGTLEVSIGATTKGS